MDQGFVAVLGHFIQNFNVDGPKIALILLGQGIPIAEAMLRSKICSISFWAYNSLYESKAWGLILDNFKWRCTLEDPVLELTCHDQAWPKQEHVSTGNHSRLSKDRKVVPPLKYLKLFAEQHYVNTMYCLFNRFRQIDKEANLLLFVSVNSYLATKHHKDAHANMTFWPPKQGQSTHSLQRSSKYFPTFVIFWSFCSHVLDAQPCPALPSLGTDTQLCCQRVAATMQLSRGRPRRSKPNERSKERRWWR